MRVVVCSVYDHKMGAFGRAQTFNTIGVAVRAFEDACKASDSPFAAHPEDFDLHQVGDFDDTTGELTRNNAGVIARAVDYIKRGE